MNCYFDKSNLSLVSLETLTCLTALKNFMITDKTFEKYNIKNNFNINGDLFNEENIDNIQTINNFIKPLYNNFKEQEKEQKQEEEQEQKEKEEQKEEQKQKQEEEQKQKEEEEQKQKEKEKQKQEEEQKQKEKQEEEQKQKQEEEEKIIIKNSNIDVLFWLFYIIDNSLEKYELLSNINIVKEKKEKIAYIETMRNNKILLKNNKIKNVSDIENYLLNKNKINIKTFFSLCVIKNLNVIYIDDNKKIMFECLNNQENNKTYLLNFKNNNYFITEKHEKKKELNKNNYIILDNVDLKIKSISSYKVLDLKNMINILNIKLDCKKNKKELYDIISLHLTI